MIRVTLSDKQFDNLELSTRRELMRQLMLLETPRYTYSLGAKGDLWTLSRYDVSESLGGRKWPDSYKPEQIDEWR